VKGFVLILMTTFCASCLVLTGCAAAGKKSGGGGAAYMKAVSGTIQTQTGDAGGFDSWLMVLANKETGEVRVAEIDNTGTYRFVNVDQGAVFTLLLLAPDFGISSVLSAVSAQYPNKVLQYFKLIDETIPSLIHRGSYIEFGDASGVALQTDLAVDTDGDAIPDGMDSDSSSSTDADSLPNMAEFDLHLAAAAATEATDIDGDAVANTIDIDVDGDGLARWFDDDDDGDENLDVFDLDADSDGVLDTVQKSGDHYFGDDVEYIAVQTIIEPLDSTNRVYLKFNVKLAADLVPVSVRIRGDATLFNESQIMIKGEDGEEASAIWDRQLLDDGASFDLSADDQVYGQKIQLRTGEQPSGDQVIFIQLGFSGADGEWFREFPFMFADLEFDEIEFSYSDNVITLDTVSPFGEDVNGDDITAFNWSVTIYDSEGTIVDNSAAIEGASTTYEIPSGKIEDGESYTAKVYVQSFDKVTGIPVYLIQSQEQDLE